MPLEIKSEERTHLGIYNFYYTKAHLPTTQKRSGQHKTFIMLVHSLSQHKKMEAQYIFRSYEFANSFPLARILLCYPIHEYYSQGKVISNLEFDERVIIQEPVPPTYECEICKENVVPDMLGLCPVCTALINFQSIPNIITDNIIEQLSAKNNKIFRGSIFTNSTESNENNYYQTLYYQVSDQDRATYSTTTLSNYATQESYAIRIRNTENTNNYFTLFPNEQRELVITPENFNDILLLFPSAHRFRQSIENISSHELLELYQCLLREVQIAFSSPHPCSGSYGFLYERINLMSPSEVPPSRNSNGVPSYVTESRSSTRRECVITQAACTFIRERIAEATGNSLILPLPEDLNFPRGSLLRIEISDNNSSVEILTPGMGAPMINRYPALSFVEEVSAPLTFFYHIDGVMSTTFTNAVSTFRHARITFERSLLFRIGLDAILVSPDVSLTNINSRNLGDLSGHAFIVSDACILRVRSAVTKVMRGLSNLETTQEGFRITP